MSVADQDEMSEEGEEVDAIEYLGSLLQTEDGDSITTVIATLAKHLESQNKILIKILSTLSAQKSS
jgi:hypothetical protein